jgi:uncharacterized protein DUF4058
MELREGDGPAVAEPEIFGVLDEPVTEGYLEIRERAGGKVITGIEFLSLANKLGGVGQQKYLEKQAYANGRYGDTDYGAKLEPPLSPDDAAWAEKLLNTILGR